MDLGNVTCDKQKHLHDGDGPLLVLAHDGSPGVSVFIVVRSSCVKVRAEQVTTMNG